jgi:mRNA interferase MazF
VVGAPLRDDVWLVSLDPTVGSEIRKTRPAVVVSPDEMNRHLRIVIVAPMTTISRDYPSRVAVRFGGKAGQVAVDQLRAIDKIRLVKRLGAIPSRTAMELSELLIEVFSR